MVTFTTGEGLPVRASFSWPDGYRGHDVGETLRVRYVSRDPSVVHPAEQSPVQPLILVIGLFFLVLSSSFAIHAWRRVPANWGRR